MTKPFITFFPGKGIYYLPTGEEVLPIPTVTEARQAFRHHPLLQRFYEREGIDIQKHLSRAEHEPLDFGQVVHVGTRTSVQPTPVDWDGVEASLLAAGYSLKVRTSISDEISQLSPVYIVEGPEGVLAEGKGLTAAQARCSALAEAIERLVGSDPSDEAREQLSLAAAGEVYKDTSVDLSTVIGPRDAYATDVMTEWLPAVNISHQVSTYFPAELAYFEYVPNATRTRLFSLHHTMGLAAGSSLEDAALSGLLEVLERDAYWITMRCRLNHPDIPLEEVQALDPNVLALIAALKRKHLQVVLKDMSLDWGIPIAHVVLFDTKQGIPAFAHGTGASFTWATAIARAVCEAVQMYEGLDAVMNGHWKWEDVVSVQGVLGNPQLAWSDPLFRPHIEHLLAPCSEKRWNRVERNWSVESFLEHLRNKGHEVIVADLHSEYGLEVVRVFVTGATQPDPRLERVNQRLLAWAARAGLTQGLYTDPILT